jgi:hypothetical protein
VGQCQTSVVWSAVARGSTAEEMQGRGSIQSGGQRAGCPPHVPQSHLLPDAQLTCR